jgi:hypothetical protein
MYISIDVGIKNLAYVIYNDSIVEWKVIELCTINASKANIIDIGKKLFEALRELTYTFTEAIIENAPRTNGYTIALAAPSAKVRAPKIIVAIMVTT